MKRSMVPILLVFTFILVACAPSQVNPPSTTQAAPISNNVSPTNQSAPVPTESADNEMVRTDEQGAVMFQVTPLNLNAPSDDLEFDVAMNTHSVDLSMDLAAVSTLSTDTGLTVQANKWDATPGGHHVSGKLIFPISANGKSILEGASKLTLTIVKVDAASRVFEWVLK